MNQEFTMVEINYWAIAPLLVVVAGALIGVLVEAFVARASRHNVQLGVGLVTYLAALVVLLAKSRTEHGLTMGGSVVIDGPSVFLMAVILCFALLSLLVMAERFGGPAADAFTPMGAATPGSDLERSAESAGWGTTEAVPLMMISVVGMMLFVSSGDLLTMFVALEVLSLPLYVLTGLARRRRLLSQEAALKYFLLGSFSSAFFLFGAALLYGYAGSVDIARIALAIGAASPVLDGLLLPGVALVLIGLLFKVGAVPFHAWTPDAYQGAPTPVTGFMAAATKIAAFGAILRLAYVGLSGNRWDWEPALIAIAALTMVIGAVMTVTQTDVKRLLAYSSIAHAGFILVAVMSFDVTGVSGAMFYLVCYGFTTIAAFALVTLVRHEGSEATDLSQWAGLGRRSPVVAGAFAICLLAFAGIPLTSGFTAKFAAFAPAISHGGAAGAWLVVIGVLASAVTAYVYFRIIVTMFFEEGAGDVVAITPSTLTTIAIAIGLVLTILLGVLPGPVLEAATQSAQFLR
ncbi:NADH-quinone oxidoreductase subunit NuoN [Kribbia dieselivorans]|uniref:NADH-quinone oxidoreductase subunit NuoN n=1 Tax=Kribbia dieselivorans TaxID=331526 RepID=UPI0008386200|nr:NADH-quinone oxidoreductase subunit NuoN [Kribbia dieselivorans]